MKNIGPAIKVGLTVLLCLGMGYWAFTMLAKGKWAGEAEEMQIKAYFKDATGLVEKSEVQISGLNVGHIIAKGLEIKPPRAELVAQKRCARITISLQSKVTLYENAMVYKKATSLLGGYYIEIDPGTPEVTGKDGKKRKAKIIPSGGEVKSVAEGVTTDDVIRQMSDVMPVLRGVAEDIRAFTKGPLKSISANWSRHGVRPSSAFPWKKFWPAVMGWPRFTGETLIPITMTNSRTACTESLISRSVLLRPGAPSGPGPGVSAGPWTTWLQRKTLTPSASSCWGIRVWARRPCGPGPRIDALPW